MTRHWLLRIVALASIAIVLVVTVVDALQGFPSDGFYVLYGGVAIVFIAVGWLIAERRPGNAVGPLLLLFGVLFAWYLPADLYLHLPDDLPGQDLAALWVSALDAPMFILIALTLILFPDGTVPSPRFRWAIPLGILGIALTVVGHLLSGEPFPLFPDLRSPIGIAGFPGLVLVYLSYVIMVVLLVTAAATLVLRARRGDPIERTKIKWVAAAGVVMLVAELINVATFRTDEPNAVTNILANLGIALVPIAMGIAILRYGLYDIDRVISRTIAYAAVTGTLVAVYLLLNLALTTVFSSLTGVNSVAVAASTLAVAALFAPIRRRIQAIVDRRFDRARYDGDQTAIAFASRLREEVDLPAVTADLDATVRSSIAPTTVAVWLRGVAR